MFGLLSARGKIIVKQVYWIGLCGVAVKESGPDADLEAALKELEAQQEAKRKVSNRKVGMRINRLATLTHWALELPHDDVQLDQC